MNERIKKLIDKMDTSGLQYQSDDCEMTVTHRDLEYFAKLIVRECVWQVVKDNEVPHDIQVLICERFKQHFGVEE